MSTPFTDTDFLSLLPPEILRLVLDDISDFSTLSKLGRTCQKYYSLTMSALYHRIVVAAPYHAHIAKLIRTIEPLLTTAQKKQLKKEGKYKGQQERHSTKIDPHHIPNGAQHVRQFVVGWSDPGRKHLPIVLRYLEEAFKNLESLEVVDSVVLTESIAKSLASQRNLQALRLHPKNVEINAIRPLAQLKNLKHLNIGNNGWYSNLEHDRVIRSIISNSMSTLQTLVVRQNTPMFSEDGRWRGLVESSSESAQGNDLVALRSLTLSGIGFDDTSIPSFQRSVNFLGLKELAFKRLGHGKTLFFQSLANLATIRQDHTQNVKLQTLTLDLSEQCGGFIKGAEVHPSLEAQCLFIGSFNTLTTLVLEDYNQYPEHSIGNPGLPDILVQAIIKHPKLKTLKINYRGTWSSHKIPYVSAAAVSTIIDNLPELQEFEFAPDIAQIDQIAHALSRGRRLQSVNCHPVEHSYPKPENFDISVVDSILGSFLSQQGSTSAEDFVWGDNFDLRRVTVNHVPWEISSRFEEPKKVTKKKDRVFEDLREPKRLSNRDGNREVWYRRFIETSHYNRDFTLGYLPDSRWVDKVSADVVGR